MQRKIITTNDGSTSIHIVNWDEQYHSKHGAIQEAKHVYINSGLAYFLSAKKERSNKGLSILEIGFGTGLNAFLTLIEAEKRNEFVNYTTVEGFPVSIEEVKQLNFISKLKAEEKADLFTKMHHLPWNEMFNISELFLIKKEKKQFSEIKNSNEFDIVYFDAFGPRVQPELWTELMFGLIYKAMKKNGVLVTYCAQGNARRAMLKVGFDVEKIDGPPGKRHMLRATKP